MLRQCSLCSDNAIKQCSCSSNIFCKRHCGEHVAEAGNHYFTEISISLPPEKQNQLAKSLTLRIQLLGECTAQIAAHSSHLVNQIFQLCSRTIKSLNKQALFYQKLLAANDYSNNQLEELDKIINSELIISSNRDFQGLNKIEEYFSQQFYFESSKVDLTEFLKIHTGDIYSVVAANDQRTIYSAGSDSTIRKWSLEERNISNLVETQTLTIRSLAISMNDRFLISGSDDKQFVFGKRMICGRLACLEDTREGF
jgi:WD40 repeat protein